MPGGLRGMLHLPPGRSGARAPAVVVLHGCTGHRVEEGRSFVLLGRALADAGLHCLRFDFRGSGESDGDFESVTLEGEVAEARAALAFVRGLASVDPARVALL